MHLEPIKDAKQVILDGVSVRFQTEGTKLCAVQFSANGKTYVIKKTNAYSDDLSVYDAQAFRTEKRFFVRGNLKGFAVAKVFDSKYSADTFVSDLPSEDRLELKVSEEDVKIDTSNSVTKSDDSSNVPF